MSGVLFRPPQQSMCVLATGAGATDDPASV